MLKTLCTTFEVARITEAIWLLLGMKWGSEYVCAMPRRVMKAILAKHYSFSCLQYKIHVLLCLNDSIMYNVLGHTDQHFSAVLDISLVYTPHKQRGITRIDFGSGLVTLGMKWRC